jgi:hypothetical protein
VVLTRAGLAGSGELDEVARRHLDLLNRPLRHPTLLVARRLVNLPILRPVQTPEPQLPPDPHGDQPPLRHGSRSVTPGYWGERLAWVTGLVLAVSAFTDWYAGSQADGLTLSVTGWHTGALGKLVFFIGLATLILEALREAGIELPATVPESLVLIAFGSLATIFTLIRLLSIPDTFFGTANRGIGIFISLIAAVALIIAGLLRAAEEL